MKTIGYTLLLFTHNQNYLGPGQTSLEDLQRWPHLNDIHIDRIPVDSDTSLFIGANIPKAMEP